MVRGGPSGEAVSQLRPKSQEKRHVTTSKASSGASGLGSGSQAEGQRVSWPGAEGLRVCVDGVPITGTRTNCRHEAQGLQDVQKVQEEERLWGLLPRLPPQSSHQGEMPVAWARMSGKGTAGRGEDLGQRDGEGQEGSLALGATDRSVLPQGRHRLGEGRLRAAGGVGGVCRGRRSQRRRQWAPSAQTGLATGAERASDMRW